MITFNQGLLTQAIAAISVPALYISVLFKIMKEKGSAKDARNKS
jgi:trans-2-enoyl-CoA reductase